MLCIVAGQLAHARVKLGAGYIGAAIHWIGRSNSGQAQLTKLSEKLLELKPVKDDLKALLRRKEIDTESDILLVFGTELRQVLRALGDECVRFGPLWLLYEEAILRMSEHKERLGAKKEIFERWSDGFEARKRRLQSVMIVEQCNEIDAAGLAEVLSDHAGHKQLVDKIKFLEELGKYGRQPDQLRDILFKLITKPNLPDVAPIPLTYWQPIFERVAELLRNSTEDSKPTFSECQTLAVLEKLQEFEMDVEFGLLEEYEDSEKLLGAITKACSTADQGLLMPSPRMLLCVFRAMRKLAPVRPSLAIPAPLGLAGAAAPRPRTMQMLIGLIGPVPAGALY